MLMVVVCRTLLVRANTLTPKLYGGTTKILRLPKHKPPNQAPILACNATHPEVKMGRNIKLQPTKLYDGILVMAVCQALFV